MSAPAIQEMSSAYSPEWVISTKEFVTQIISPLISKPEATKLIHECRDIFKDNVFAVRREDTKLGISRVVTTITAAAPGGPSIDNRTELRLSLNEVFNQLFPQYN